MKLVASPRVALSFSPFDRRRQQDFFVTTLQVMFYGIVHSKIAIVVLGGEDLSEGPTYVSLSDRLASEVRGSTVFGGEARSMSAVRRRAITEAEAVPDPGARR